MMGFNRRLVLSVCPQVEDVYRVEVSFWFRDSNGIKWYTPAGTYTDLASIPRLLWSCVGHPAESDIAQAAVTHDCLYRNPQWLSRKRCDEILIEGMQCLGASWMKRQAVYYGLRIGGGFSWANYRKKEDGL